MSRLIDADELPKTEIYDEDGKAYCVVLEEDIDQAQTVKAIPIEWIENWVKMCNWHYTDLHNIMKSLIADWEKENE